MSLPPASREEDVQVEEADAKRRKIEDAASTVEEEIKATVEREADAEPLRVSLLAEQVRANLDEATLNVIPTVNGNVLTPLTDGGLQYLIAGSRFNVGVKSGRYLFEIKILESLNPSELPTRVRVPTPKQLVRVGFSAQETSLFLGETDDSVCFDSEGCFTVQQKRTQVSKRFGRDSVVGVVVNMDKSSINAHTVSLFVDGQRASQPMQLPENLKGKALYPHVNFKNVTLQVNFGPSPLVALPFRCHMVQGMAESDAEISSKSAAYAQRNGKYEVIFPVGLPGEGTFDWLDQFLEKNPKYTELSDRKILDWAAKSSLWRPAPTPWKNSNDKPDMNFGIPLMDDYSIHRVLNAIVASQPRNYVVMEVKSNLLREERAILMKRFDGPQYVKIAMVVMGEPTKDFRRVVQEMTLKEKQEQAELEWKTRNLERQRKKAADKAQREAEAAQKAAAAKDGGDVTVPTIAQQEGDAQAKPEGNAATETPKEDAKPKSVEGDVVEDGSMVTGAAVNSSKVDTVGGDAATANGKQDDIEMRDGANKIEDDELEETQPPVVELTDEEQSLRFRKKSIPDLTTWALSTNFTKFAVPEKDEGFDDIQFAWQKGATSKEYLKEWIKRHKVECRIEDLMPGEWFNEKWADWQKVLKELHDRQAEFQATGATAPVKKDDEVPKGDGQVPEAKDADDGGGKPASDGEKEKEKVTSKQDIGETDIFAVDDVRDVGGRPLFAEFSYEDWSLLTIRVELHLLLHAFKRDVTDPERLGIHEQHLAFYYNKYFRKSFNVTFYTVSTNPEFISMIKDTVTMTDDTKILVPQLKDDLDKFDIFVKLTEDGRRDRQRRIDAGDDNARLKFTKPEPESSVQLQIEQPPPALHAPRTYQGTGAGVPYQNRDASKAGAKSYHSKGYGGGGYGGTGGGYGAGKGAGPYMGPVGGGSYRSGPAGGKSSYGGPPQGGGYGGAPLHGGQRRPYGGGYGKGYK
eukprot:TRINITY_DN3330_c0_g1_i1.p1 TRINITY_DN3330_c0_g1~~TRINITY_DN3330_c0_g1_i1.p1  ORF type:complete len:971 (-),score=224.21 TRINITY_DN3330_c0_g1_i1:136-3048(-)